MRSPDLLIVGGQKCGTTAARINLALHPHVTFNSHGGRGREVHFFDRDVNWARGLSWYQTHFQTPAPVVAEKTPNYLQPEALARIARVLPHAKLIILLRHPVDRAYSQWNHFNQQPSASGIPWRLLAFENAVEAYPNLLSHGHYDVHLEAAFEHFPRSQIHVAITERVRADMALHYARMLRFAGLQPIENVYYRPAHVRPYHEPMNDTTRTALNAYFAPHMDRVRALLDDQIAEWESGHGQSR